MNTELTWTKTFTVGTSSTKARYPTATPTSSFLPGVSTYKPEQEVLLLPDIMPYQAAYMERHRASCRA